MCRLGSERERERVGPRHPELRNYLRVPQIGPGDDRIVELAPPAHV